MEEASLQTSEFGTTLFQYQYQHLTLAALWPHALRPLTSSRLIDHQPENVSS